MSEPTDQSLIMVSAEPPKTWRPVGDFFEHSDGSSHLVSAGPMLALDGTKPGLYLGHCNVLIILPPDLRLCRLVSD